jgi:copper transport protein
MGRAAVPAGTHHRHSGLSPLVLPVLLAMGLLAFAPRPVLAHSALIAASPASGERLRTAPGVVVLTFSQPLDIALSRATVTTPDGRRVQQTSVSESQIRIDLSTNQPGIYDIVWTSVSQYDGHTLTGELRFGVGVASVPTRAVEPAPGPADLGLAAARTVEYAALLLAVGLALMLELARRRPSLAWVRTPLPTVLAVAAVSATAVIAAEWLAAVALPSVASLAAYLGAGPAGWVRASRPAMEAVAALVALRRPRAAGIPLAAALVLLAAAGHAASDTPLAGGVALATTHLLTAGLWAGGILALGLQRPPGGWRRGEGLFLVARFTPVALAAFSLTAATGLLQAVVNLRGPADLVSTAYGQVLGLKALLVLSMLPLSVLAWRRRRPRPRLEAGLALAVVGASALLAAFPVPSGRVPGALAAGIGPAEGQARPADPDLTLAAPAGDTLVGLTLRPGRPGPNTAWLWLLPLAGDQAAAQLHVSIAVGALRPPVRSCGAACRATDLVLDGGETLAVTLAPSGGTSTFTLPRLPAPRGQDLIDRAQTRMHDLAGYGLDETLRPAVQPVAVSYTYQAPDRERIQITGGSDTILIGSTRYSRGTPGAPWAAESTQPVRVPDFVWDGSQPVASRALGSLQDEGHQLSGAAFFEDAGGVPTWFEIWLDEAGLVRRAQMLAAGHFMEDRFRDFDSAAPIEPP